MQLAHRRKIGLQDRVEPLLRQPWLTRIGLPKTTWHQLLTHTSGLDDLYQTGKVGFGNAWLTNKRTNDDFLVAPIKLDLLLPQILTKRTNPGPLSYSNDGYALLSYLVSRVSGQPFDTYVQRRVFRPLGMRQSSFGRRGLGEDVPVAEGYGAYVDGDVHPQTTWPPYEVCTVGDGGMWSTANDLARFVRAHLSKEGPGNGVVLSRNHARTMQQTFAASRKNRQGLGWAIWGPWVGHEGSNPGYTSAIALHDGKRIGYAVLANQDLQHPEMKHAWEQLLELLETELLLRAENR